MTESSTGTVLLYIPIHSQDAASFSFISLQFPYQLHLQIELVIVRIFRDEWAESLLELLNAHLLPVPILQRLRHASFLWWDENAVDDLKDTILRDTILHNNDAETVDPDGYPGSETGDIHSESLVLEKGREIEMEIPACLGANFFIGLHFDVRFGGAIVSIGV